jgi:hypothetical protein
MTCFRLWECGAVSPVSRPSWRRVQPRAYRSAARFRSTGATVTSLSVCIANGRECSSGVVASSAPPLWRAQGHDRGQDGGDGDDRDRRYPVPAGV